MNKTHIRINDGELIPLYLVKRLRRVTDSDRKSLAQLGDHVNAELFQTRIEFADNAARFAKDSIDDIRRQDIDAD